jgi:hypothetical protein
MGLTRSWNSNVQQSRMGLTRSWNSNVQQSRMGLTLLVSPILNCWTLLF